MSLYREQCHTPPPNEATNVVFVAFRVAERFRNRIPSYVELMRDFGMSKSTAHRWVKAIREARGAA